MIKCTFLRTSVPSLLHAAYYPPNPAQSPSRNCSPIISHYLPSQRIRPEFLLCTWPHQSSCADLLLPLDMSPLRWCLLSPALTKPWYNTWDTVRNQYCSYINFENYFMSTMCRTEKGMLRVVSASQGHTDGSLYWELSRFGGKVMWGKEEIISGASSRSHNETTESWKTATSHWTHFSISSLVNVMSQFLSKYHYFHLLKALHFAFRACGDCHVPIPHFMLS